jgi:mannose-6-phosphate isomerase-like protein (cupin superfamily)
MLMRIKHVAGVVALASALAIGASAQSHGVAAKGRTPSTPTRPFVVLSGQSVSDIEKKLGTDNKVEELFGGQGMQLRVAVQHEKEKAAATGEVHDASDDVYYVLEGSATLTLGGKLEAPREVEPGEWRGKITGGKAVDINKGDLIVVPRGTPHERSTVGKDFTMILIKIFEQPLPAPKK